MYSRNMPSRFICAVIVALSYATASPTPRWQCDYDVLIYGATPAAITAAIQTVRMNRTVAIVCPETHIGGLTSSGIGWTDSKNGSAIGGLSREFYEKVYDYYLSDSAWVHQSRASYVSESILAQPGLAIEIDKQVQWTFEPHVAERIFEDWLKEYNVPVFRNEWLDRSPGQGVTKNDKGVITSIKMLSGNSYSASVFIDAGYNGDLMASADVSFRVGRESKAEYNESLAGYTLNNDTIYAGIDPYNTPGDSSSGLIPHIQGVVADPRGLNGTADSNRLQAYNYRVALTKVPERRIAFTKPSNYDEGSYEILFRYVDTGYRGQYFTQQYMPNNITDSNANSSVSTDLLGGNFDEAAMTNYAIDSYDQRHSIAQAHKSWMQGFFWTLAYHERIPEDLRNVTSEWGYANDEWADNDHWPYEVYIRESRRMNGSYTISQQDVQSSDLARFGNDSIVGLGSYTMDVHVVQRVVVDDMIHDEGLVHTPVGKPYPLPYNSIVPLASDATNLLNPVTLSATHVAFASIRLEPTYMILGQSAATAAVMAIEQGVAVQDVDRTKLTERLLADNQILEWTLS